MFTAPKKSPDDEREIKAKNMKEIQGGKVYNN
jgi:hypothetical protein